MIARLAAIVGLIIASPLWSLSVKLINDSAFYLSADVYTADGRLEVSVKLSPGESYIWYASLNSFVEQADKSTTPYTVRWVCRESQPYDYSKPKKGKKGPSKKYESEFGSWVNVPPGATVTALGSTDGSKTCVIKKKGNKPAPKKYIMPKRSEKSKNNENWTNDGGENWTNDGGPGWDHY